MVRKHLSRIDIKEDGRIFGGKSSFKDYHELVFEDNDYITCNKLLIMSDIELPKYIKKVKQEVVFACYCPTAVKDVRRLLSKDIDLAITACGTINEMQDMLDLTVHSVECVGVLQLDLGRNLDRGELHFDTNANVVLSCFNSHEVVLCGKVGNLTLIGNCANSNKIKLHPNFSCKDFKGGYRELDRQDFKDYSLLPDGFDESLLERLQRLIGIDE